MRKIARRAGMALAAGAAAIALTLSAPLAASAVTGTLGCGSNYGWLKITAAGFVNMKPPGSDVTYQSPTGGTWLRVAIYSNGVSKTGGGSWLGTGSGGVSLTAPQCSPIG